MRERKEWRKEKGRADRKKKNNKVRKNMKKI